MFENLSFSEVSDWVVTFLKDYGWGILGAILGLLIGLRIIKFIQKQIWKGLEKTKIRGELRTFTTNLLGWLMKFFLFLVIAGMIGVETTSFIAIIGAAGLAVGLALQGTLANFAGGVLIMLFEPFGIEDLIDAQGELGTVKSIQIFNTILLSPDNKTIILPNGALMNGNITNYSREGQIRVELVVGIDYSADVNKAITVLTDMLGTDSRVLKTPAPMVGVLELGDNSVNLAVRPWCNPAEYWDVYFDTMKNIKLTLDEVGIGIPFPQRDVHIISQPSA